jgi:Methyltransferase domain
MTKTSSATIQQRSTEGFDLLSIVKRASKSVVKQVAVVAINNIAPRFGFFVLPKHYYTPIAETRVLRRSVQAWAQPALMTGVNMEVTRQLDWLRNTVAPFEPEYRGNKVYNAAVAGETGPGYGEIEAQCLHGVIRGLKPKRVVEVGSGVSTACIHEAMRQNGFGEITCIEPFPRLGLRKLPVKLIEQPVEMIDINTFNELEAGDLLFIDSSHAIRPGGDVLHLYLRVIPGLRPGVLIHIHDIYLPYLHQPDLFTSAFQWTETALLLALLTNNSHLHVLACQSLLHYAAASELKTIFPEYTSQPAVLGLAQPGAAGHFPTSIYLEVT